MTPVILIGAEVDGLRPSAFGLFENLDMARQAIWQGRVPVGYYWSIVTPQMNEIMVPYEPLTEMG